MRYRAAAAVAAAAATTVTDDKARATGPFHSPKQQRHSWILSKGSATLQVHKESALEPPAALRALPRARSCLQVKKAREAALCTRQVCGEVLGAQVPEGYVGSGD